MRFQGGTEGETEGDRGKKTVRGCHPCHAYLSPANPGILLVVTPVTPVSCQRRRLSSKIDNLPRWRAQQFFKTKPPPYLASGTLHEQPISRVNPPAPQSSNSSCWDQGIRTTKTSLEPDHTPLRHRILGAGNFINSEPTEASFATGNLMRCSELTSNQCLSLSAVA